jgi:tetratricopeptide (TPR) repeat protein
MKNYRMIFLSLLVLLPSSSFSIYQYIDTRITNGNATPFEVEFAALALRSRALKYQVDNVEVGSPQWLTAINSLARKDIDSAYMLSQFYRFNNKDLYYYWLNVAAGGIHVRALSELATDYYHKGEYRQVLKILNDYKKPDDVLKSIYFKSLLALGETKNIQDILQSISDKHLREDLSAALFKYQVFPTKTKLDLIVPKIKDKRYPETKPSIGPQCQKNITLVATNFEDLVSLDKTKVRLSAHPLSQYLCVGDVVYRSLPSLACTDEANRPIMCDESRWREYEGKIDSDYLGILLPKGGANTHYGIIYFDREDSFQVITHELSHLLGFVDEYQLSDSHTACQYPLGAKGLNISLLSVAFPKPINESYGSPKQLELRSSIISQLAWGDSIDEKTPIMKNVGDMWVLGTPSAYQKSIGLFPSETCQLDMVKSFKPMDRLTSLRHTDVATPKAYYSILESSRYDFSMPSYHYNVALSLFRAGNEQEAKKWLELALSVSSMNSRFEHL